MKSKLKDRKKKINSFKVVGIGIPPLTRNLSVNKYIRSLTYSYINVVHGVKLPNYYNVSRENLSKEDLVVFEDNWWIEYEYDGWVCRLIVKIGAIIDYASVPDFIVRGNFRQRGQHIDEAAVMHDTMIALHHWPVEDAANIMIGMINHIGLTNWYDKLKYTIGVRSKKCEKIRNSIKPEDHWLKDYVYFSKERII